MGPCFEIEFCSIAYTRESVSDIAECWDKSDDGRYEDDGLIRVQEKDMNMLASNKKARICVKNYAKEAREIGLENLHERVKIAVHSR